jgi:hypothetical protein
MAIAEEEMDVLVNVIGDVLKPKFAKLQEGSQEAIVEALQQVAKQLGRQNKILISLVTLLANQKERPPRTFTIRHDDGTQSTVNEGAVE